MKGFSTIQYYLSVPWIWLRLTLHNTWGILNVLDLIWLRPLPGGLIDHEHPFCTGINPETGREIWWSNLLYRTPRRTDWPEGEEPETDEAILQKTGHHLCLQVRQAARSPGHPSGHASPMPPGILYIHGGVHYNGGWLLFNDFKEAIRHFADPRFRAEFKRFVREEKREPVTLFRDRHYDRAEFARFVCFMRSVLPWFSNCNGPKKFVLWGNPAPYPAVNTITGHWIRDTRALQSPARQQTVARPPLEEHRYFQSGPYAGDRDTTLWPENLLAWLTHLRIRARGRRENLYFVDKRKLKEGYRFGPAPIRSPWQKLTHRVRQFVQPESRTWLASDERSMKRRSER